MSNLKRSFQEKTLLHNIVKYKDSDAFATVYDAYISKIYRFVLFKVSSQEDAQDITSMVFLKAWSYLTDSTQKKEMIKSISGLLYTIARNLVVDHYRERAKKQSYSIQDLSIDLASDTNVEESFVKKQESITLIDSLKMLKQEYQEVLTLRYLDELSLKEISHVLGKTMVNVRVLLHRATKKLEEIHTPTTGIDKKDPAI